MSAQSIPFSLDEKIKKRFHLFDGTHPKDVDETIYKRVYALCFKELIFAIEETLDIYQRQVLLAQLESIEHSSLDQETKQIRSIELVLNSIDHDATFRFQVEARLHAFIDNIFV